METFLNKKNRQKNVFDVFFNQKNFEIKQPKNNENEKSNILLFVSNELKSNQYENIPVIYDDNVKKIDTDILSLTNNEKHLSNEKESSEEKIGFKSNEKGLNIDKNQVDIVNNITDNEIINDEFILDKIVQNTVNKNNDNLNTYNKRKKTNNKNTIFKKFKK